MTEYTAGEIKTHGVTVPITVDDHGTWEATHAGNRLRADSRDQLATMIARATKQTTRRVSVPFVRVTRKGTSGITVRRGTATGVHSANGNILVTWVIRGKEAREQLSRYWGDTQKEFFGDVSDDVLTEYHRLVIAEATARVAQREFSDKHKIQLHDLVTEALDTTES